MGKRTFAGSETVKLKVRQPVRGRPERARLKYHVSAVPRWKAFPNRPSRSTQTNETLTHHAANELPAGEHSSRLSFSRQDQQQGQGLYYAPYQEQGTGAQRKSMLGTQFEATDARRLFPAGTNRASARVFN